jgi:hypothetical protein
MSRRILAIGLLCGALLALRNAGGLAFLPAGSDMAAPVWRDGLLARPAQAAQTGAAFLCRRASCAEVPAWPASDDPSAWLSALGQERAHRQDKRSVRAPSLLRVGPRWVILWTESGDRLEVLIEGRGSGVWPVARFAELRRLPWWGPLR